MNQQEILIQILEGLQTKNTNMIISSLECDQNLIADVIKELPISKCEALFSFLLKKINNHKLQINCMKWITYLCDTRPQLFLNNSKFKDLVTKIKVSDFDQYELIGKLEMIVQQ
ncbi:unnamed protein product [Paramecium sonneborni]|uniref:Uncharacterized protein n=1 Tax=Paramecium sonneborni TaxID=65129 RepID=A0A8S1N2W3_9CILI|nr:unnamed protein product [Paramecium sonneborni]